MKGKLKPKKLIIIGIVLVLVIALLFVFFGGDEAVVQANKAEVVAEYGDITESVSQSGTVEPYERREITTLAQGEVIASPFNEGDMVNVDDILYQIDDEDAQLSLERAQNTVSKSQLSLNDINRNIAKLNIYASETGTLKNFNLNAGDSVAGGEIGQIVNTDSLKVKIPFTSADYDKISIGNSVTVTSAAYMTSLNGTVTYKYDSNAGTGSDGSLLKNVEVSISNPGALTAGTTVSGMVNTSSGTVYSAKSGSIESGTTTSLRAEVSGTVKKVYKKSGDKVTKGQLIVSLESESLEESKKNAELNLSDSKLSLESTQKTLDDYIRKSPISGTVITKNIEVGDIIDNANASQVLMVVADMSKMKFTIAVDELDIGNLKVGMEADVDADALPGQQFKGYVSSIASEGTVSGQGVTTYDVEIVIDEPGELVPGMNVNATVVISDVKDVLRIPEEALQMAKGGRAIVYVKTDKTPDEADFPDDYEEREVEYGASNGTFVEITSGLEEGETVVYIQLAGSGDDFSEMMQGMAQNMHNNANGMMGGGASGGAPSGGPGGGAPAGR